MQRDCQKFVNHFIVIFFSRFALPIEFFYYYFSCIVLSDFPCSMFMFMFIFMLTFMFAPRLRPSGAPRRTFGGGIMPPAPPAPARALLALPARPGPLALRASCGMRGPVGGTGVETEVGMSGPGMSAIRCLKSAIAASVWSGGSWIGAGAMGA